MGFGDRTPACREYTHPRADSHSRVHASIPERTVIGLVLQVHFVKFLGTHGIEIQMPSTTTKKSNPLGVVICRGKTRFVDELLHRDQGHNPTSSELLLERSIAKESEPCATELETQDVSFLQGISRNRWRINGVPVEYAPRISSLKMPQEFQRDLERKNIKPEELTDRIILM